MNPQCRRQAARCWGSICLLLGLALGLQFGCGSREAQRMFEEDTIDLRPIQWTTQMAMLGKVAAVADSQEDVAVFGSLGASVWNDGLEVGNDTTVTSWRAAAVVPALDLPESWLVGIDQLGRIYRMRNRVMLEDVTARFGLTGKPAIEIVALNATLSAVALKDKVAVVNGATVQFYDMRARGLAGAAGRLAAFDYDGILTVDFSSAEGAKMLRLPLPGAVGVGFDVTGELRLVAATEQALYIEQNGALVPIWEAPAESKIVGLTSSGRGVWLAIGKELALFRGMQLLHGSMAVPEGGRLIGSPSGDVWVLAGSQLTRMGERAPGGTDEDRWRRNMLPIFHRVCRGCHMPAGSSNIDLSTYDKWVMRRPAIKQRLIDQLPTPMPPTSAGTLTPDELNAVSRWAAATP